MTITHQTLLDHEGKPTAALIPWDEFEVIRDRLADEDISLEWSEAIGKRADEIDKGEVELIDGEDFLQRLRAV
jgi:PHD/YefM family antitoxin component YafN of YafNO toxin-antitoxin module